MQTITTKLTALTERSNRPFFAFALLLCATLLCFSNVHAQRLDLTDDGLSEIIMIDIDGEGNLDWRVLSSDSGYSTNFLSASDLGENGNQIVVGDYLGTGTAQLGFVKRQSGSNLANWTIDNGSGGTTSADFGPASGVAIAGVDFDGDGVADIAVVKKNGEATLRLSPFITGESEDINFRFPSKATSKIKGKKGEIFFYNGGLGAAYANRKGRLRGVVQNLSNGERTRFIFSSVPRGNLKEVVSIRDGSSTLHYLTHEQLNNRTSRVRIFTSSGSLVFGQSFTGDTVVVGNFIAGGVGEQFGVKNGTTLSVISPFGGPSGDITVGSGVIVDAFNVNGLPRAGGSSGGGDNGGGDNSGGNNGGGSSGPGLRSVCPSIASFGAGRLWKPDSDVNDNRGGKPVLLLTGSNKTSRSGRKVFDSEGNEICRGMTFKSSSIPGVNNGADHYYSGWVGGCSLTGGQMASRARQNTGSKEVYVQWKSNSCLRVPDPDSRFGGI